MNRRSCPFPGLLPLLEELEQRQLLSTNGLLSAVQLPVLIQPVVGGLIQTPAAAAGPSQDIPAGIPGVTGLGTSPTVPLSLTSPAAQAFSLPAAPTVPPNVPGGSSLFPGTGIVPAFTNPVGAPANSILGPGTPNNPGSGIPNGNLIGNPIGNPTGNPLGNPTGNPTQAPGSTAASTPNPLNSPVLVSPNGNATVSSTVPQQGLFVTQAGLPFGSAIQQATLIRPGQLFNDVVGANVVTGAIRNPMLDGGGGIIDDTSDDQANPPPVGIVPIEPATEPDRGGEDGPGQEMAPIGKQEMLLPDSAAVPLTVLTPALDRTFIQLGRDLASTLGSLPLSPWLTSLILTATVLEWARQRRVRSKLREEETAPCWRVLRWEAA